MGSKDFLKSVTLNEWVEEEASIIPDILHFFSQENFMLIREKSGNFEEWCLLQPCFILDHVQLYHSCMAHAVVENRAC